MIVNATGPWLDHLRRLEDPASVPSIRLSKGVASRRRRRRGLGRRGHDPPEQGARRLRQSRGSECSSWDDGHTTRGEPDDARVTEQRTCARSSTKRRARSTASTGRCTHSFLGLRVLPRRPRRDRERARADGLHPRPRPGCSQRRSQQADDVPPDRARRARAARRPGLLNRAPRPLPGAIGPRPRRVAGRPTHQPAAICCTCTAHGRPKSSVPRSTTRHCSAARPGASRSPRAGRVGADARALRRARRGRRPPADDRLASGSARFFAWLQG